MSVALLIVAHNGIGEQLHAVARSIMQPDMPALELISIPASLQPEALGGHAERIRDKMRSMDRGDGVLVLTDVCGATPDNLARHFSEECNATVVSGVNLPMLLRVLNYAHLSIGQLCEKAISGGQCGIQAGEE